MADLPAQTYALEGPRAQATIRESGQLIFGENSVETEQNDPPIEDRYFSIWSLNKPRWWCQICYDIFYFHPETWGRFLI